MILTVCGLCFCAMFSYIVYHETPGQQITVRFKQSNCQTQCFPAKHYTLTIQLVLA